MFKTALLVASLVLSGCAYMPVREQWTKPGLSEDQWKKDSYECFREAKTAYPEDRIDNAVQRMANMCLQSRGYTRVAK